MVGCWSLFVSAQPPSTRRTLGPGDPPKGWEANYVRTLPNRGWFPYMRAYGAGKDFFGDTYKLPTITNVKDFSEYIK